MHLKDAVGIANSVDPDQSAFQESKILVSLQHVYIVKFLNFRTPKILL